MTERIDRTLWPSWARSFAPLVIAMMSSGCAPRSGQAPAIATTPARTMTPAPAGSAVRALRFGRLVDGTGRVVSDAVVVVTGDRVTAVGVGAAAIPRGAAVTDLRRYTAIPGLIDVHTHMMYWWDRAAGTEPWSELRRPSAMTVFLAQENARRTLESGVTTVRDMGSFDHGDIALRELIARGAIVGPRMFVSGYGLHRARGTPLPDAALRVPRGGVTDAAEIERAVQAQVDAGVDQIKMFGSTGSGADLSGRPTFSRAEMTVAVDAAHRLGRRIAIHSYGPEGGRDAVFAGAESVEHAVDLDDATLAEMARRGTVYVPTIDHNRYYAEHLSEYRYTAAQGAALDAYRARNLETARRAFRAGVKLAMGSDAVFTMFGQNTRELGWFVQIGMTPAQAIAAATTTAAALLGQERALGAVAPGYYADIVAVEGDPLTDIAVVLRDVRWVMKGGAVVVDRR